MASSEAAPPPLPTITDVYEAPMPFAAATPPPPPPAAPPATSDEAMAADPKLKAAAEDVFIAENGPKPVEEEMEEAAPLLSEKVSEEAEAEKENGDAAIEKEKEDAAAATIEEENEDAAAATIEPPDDDAVKEPLVVEAEPEKTALDLSAEAEAKTDEEGFKQPEDEIEEASKSKSTVELLKDDIETGASQLESEPEPTQATASPKRKEKSISSPKSNSHPSYTQMITDAIITLQDRTGSSQHAISKSIEAKYKSALTPNFKKSLAIQLKRLCENGELVKVKNSYKLSGKAKNKLKKAGGKMDVKPKPEKTGGKKDAKPKPEKTETATSKRKTKPTKKTATAKTKKGRTTSSTSKKDKTTRASSAATKAPRTKTAKSAKTEIAEPTSTRKPARSGAGKSSSASTKPPEKAAPTPAPKKSSRSREAKSAKPSTTGAKATKRNAPASSRKSLETAAPAKRARRSSK